MLAETPHLIAHRNALEAWRSLSHEEQVARMGAMAPSRPPEPAGGRIRVGLWSPCGLYGGAETWQLTLARSVDPAQIAWQGCCLVGGSGIAREATLDDLRAIMPVSAGRDEARDLAARCEVLVTWDGTDPAHLFEGMANPPKVVYAVHMPAVAFGGKIPVPASSIDRYVSVSELALDAVPSDRRDGCEVIWNAVDPARLEVRRDRATMRRLWGVPVDAPAAGYLGRLSTEKDPLAMARLAAHLPTPWQVVVVGEGHLGRDLKRDAPPNLHVVGGDPAAGDVLNAFDCLLSTSRYESFGLTIAEALWSGVPVLATRTGLPAMVDGLVRHIPFGLDGRSLAASVVVDAMDAEGTRARVERGSAFARERLSLDRFGRQWTGVLVGLGERHRAERVAKCPARGGVLPLSMQCESCKGKELSECRDGKGHVKGRVTLRDCMACIGEAG